MTKTKKTLTNQYLVNNYIEDINFALVEETRPPIYTTMKYWGKKPHNIWREYIKRYTPVDGLYLDAFAGSAMSAFEAVKAGKKAIAFDINPLTTFLIETFCSKFDKENFIKAVNNIVSEIKNDLIYKKYFYTICRKCENTSAVAQNFKWNNNKLYEIGIDCPLCNSRYVDQPKIEDHKKSIDSNSITITNWIPSQDFYPSSSFSVNFIKNIGGKKFINLWTKRNLYIISKIFFMIEKETNKDLQKQLLLGFIKSIHLCSKMCVPRRAGANRAFSTSWGRSAYICARRQMEMNPLLVFEGSCFGKQSVESGLKNIKSYLGKIPKIFYVDESNKSIKTKNFDIKYGIVDVNTIDNFIEEDSIDFIMTDPPYGGLVQYLDLSAIWLIWLSKIDNRFKLNYENEITIKKGYIDIATYKSRFENGLKNLFKILKANGKIVFTFHNQDITIWNAFLRSISASGFAIEKVIHQQNRRTGESNVANPYGTSATDFYIRCIKKSGVNFKNDQNEFEYLIVNKAINLIAMRNEPTPYQILFNGLLAEISLDSFNIENFDSNIQKILSKNIDKIFKLIKNNDNNGGDYWWLENPSMYIKDLNKKLTDRVKITITEFLKRKISVTFDEVLGEIFVKYPNGLMPEIKSIKDILSKVANKSSGGHWIYKGIKQNQEYSQHTEMLYHLSIIGKKIGYRVFIGKKEQADIYKNKKLSEYADILELNFLDIKKDIKKRLEMIDMLWITSKNEVRYAIEVENSTSFTSGIQRASNLDVNIKKIMLVPDNRKDEFLNIQDPLFIDAIKKYNWYHLFYSDIKRFASSKNISDKILTVFLERKE
ncbi:MAG: DNA adenine methylase [Alphaproteobacteria bacterium]